MSKRNWNRILFSSFLSKQLKVSWLVSSHFFFRPSVFSSLPLTFLSVCVCVCVCVCMCYEEVQEKKRIDTKVRDLGRK